MKGAVTVLVLLAAAAAKGQTLQGTVVDATSAPLRDVTVELISQASS